MKDVGLSLILDDPSGCCALDEGHDGPCAYVCSDCNGTQRCWACDGDDPCDDLGSGCTECDGRGNCLDCHEGLVTDG